jgi:hypothetical protein
VRSSVDDRLAGAHDPLLVGEGGAGVLLGEEVEVTLPIASSAFERRSQRACAERPRGSVLLVLEVDVVGRRVQRTSSELTLQRLLHVGLVGHVEETTARDGLAGRVVEDLALLRTVRIVSSTREAVADRVRRLVDERLVDGKRDLLLISSGSAA